MTERARTRYVLFAMLVGAVSWGCSSPSEVAPPDASGVALQANRVVWTSSTPTFGAVRYGRRPAAYTTIAYPLADRRGDKTAMSTHLVPLLGVAAGDTLYGQLLDTPPGGTTRASEEMMFIVTTAPSGPPLLEWTMIDVGFGDSHLLTMPNSGRRILIDAGERRDWPNVDVYLQARGVSRLDWVVATHIHIDHIGGLVGESFADDDGVLGAYEIGGFVDGPNHSAQRDAYDELLALLADRSIPRVEVVPGDDATNRSELVWDPAVTVRVLNAGGGHAIGGDTEASWLNNDSIVFRITYGAVDLLLGGDAEQPVESRLVTSGLTLDSEVLKIHHHGVDDASGGLYLDTVNPRVGLIPITTYESNIGTLPSQAVMSRMRQRTIDVYASDRAEPLGIVLTGNTGFNLTVSTDGASYQIHVAPSLSQHFPGSTVRTGAEAECVH